MAAYSHDIKYFRQHQAETGVADFYMLVDGRSRKTNPIGMKNTSLVLNIVLLVAVAFLYFLHFRGNKSMEPGQSSAANVLLSANAGNIFFVNTDTLLEHYEYFKKQKSDFEQKQERVRAELKSEGDHLQSEVSDYQKKASGMTEMQRQQEEEKLMQKQQQLVQKKDAMMNELDEEQSKSSDELYSRLSNYMKKFNAGKPVHYVLSRQRGSGILFANDSLDITSSVIEGLNEEFRKTK